MYTKMVYIKTGKADTSTDSSFAARIFSIGKRKE